MTSELQSLIQCFSASIGGIECTREERQYKVIVAIVLYLYVM